MSRFHLVASLEPEQKTVLNIGTLPTSSNEFVLVQGVAGSGKTTIALHILDKLGEIAASQPLDDRFTLLLLTYNRKLAESCANTLRDRPALAQAQLVSRPGELERGCLNILTFHDLCKLILTDDDREQIREDQVCINEIGRIARVRGVHDLLPSQIFSLITTFLRGRPELLELDYEQLKQRIDEEMQRSVGYRMYGDFIGKVYRWVLRDYEDWKQRKGILDRSDIACKIHLALTASETYLRQLSTMTAKQIRAVSHKILGDGDVQIGKVMTWLRRVMRGMESCGAIETQAAQYRTLLGGSDINQDQLDQLRRHLLLWIRDYGLRGSPVWETLGRHLINPVIVVDEFQDLSAIEIEVLISLWFQLQRSRNSRLILFGDLNQQMNPVGFEWSHVLNLLRERAKLYGNYADSYFNLGFAKDTLRPFELDNNYRTTEEIARLAHQMVKQVATYSFEREVAHRYLEYAINPERTVPYNIANKIEGMSEGERLPRILIGPHHIFINALRRYLAQVERAGEASDLTDELLTTVIITEYPEVLENFIQSEETGSALSRLSYIPTLSCKGLEFDSCVLFGVSTKQTGRLEADILSRWYTSFTRAKIRLLVYLTPEEYAYMQQAGWTNIEDDVAWVRQDPDVDTVFEALKWVGTTELDEEGHKVVGEISLARFFGSQDERWLRESLRHFELAGWRNEREKAAFQAAEHFEGQKDYLRAAEYYGIASRPIEQVHCLEARRRQLLEEGSATAEVTAEIERVIRGVPNSDHFTRARCYLEIQEWEKALAHAQQAAQGEGVQIADKVLDAIQRQLRSGITTAPSRLPEMLEKYGFLDQAGLAWVEMGNWEQALRCARKASLPTQDRIVRIAVEQIKNGQLSSRVRRSIAEQLEKHEYWREAANGFIELEDRQSAIRCLVQIPDLPNARAQLEHAAESERLACLRILAAAHYEHGKETWPEASFYHREAGEIEEVNRILQRCRDNREYVLLTQCYTKIGEKDEARRVANERQIQDGHREAEMAALCWSVIGDWEDAVRCWMQAYYRDLGACEALLGPDPRANIVHRATLSRCFRHLEERREAYGISQERWEQLMRSASESEDRARQAIESMVAIAAQSKAWQEELQTFFRRLDESVRRSGLVSPGQTSPLPIPADDRPLRSEEIARLWDVCRAKFSLFRTKADEVANNLYQSGEDRLLALKLLHHVCHNQRKARELAEDLSRKGDDESRRLWVRSWRILEITEEEVQRRLQDLDPVADSAWIRFAIDDYYRDDPKLRSEALERYRERLKRLTQPEARRLLQEIFPDGTESSADIPTDHKPADLDVAHDMHHKLVALLEELSQRTRDHLNEEDGEDFQKQVRLIRENPTETDRLQRRWNKAKACLPLETQEIKDLASRVEDLVERIIAEQPTAKPENDAQPVDMEPAAT